MFPKSTVVTHAAALLRPARTFLPGQPIPLEPETSHAM
jgi:hypothetical protein